MSRPRRVCGCRPLHVWLCLPFAAAATLLLAWQQEIFFRANSEIGWGAPSTSFQNAERFLPKEEPAAAEPQAPEPKAADPAPQLDTEETQDHITKPAEIDGEEEEKEADATPAEVKVLVLPKKHQMPQPKTLLGVYEELCRMGIQSPGGIRNAGAEVRDAVVKLYQNLVERPPPAPFHRERMVHLASPNCKDPMWRHLLDGSRRKTPRIVIDVTTGMGGGPELDLLEMRLWEINASLSHLDGPPPVKDVYVVTESAFGLRGDAKPMHFSRQRERFRDFLPQIEHVILDNCSKYSREVEKMRQENSKRKRRGGTMFSAEGIQRICVLKTLIERRPEIPDDALVIFSDLDEVPSAKAIQMLRVCKSLPAAKEGPWIQEHYPMPYNLRVGCKAKRGAQLHMQGVFVTMGFLRRKKTLALRYNVRQNRIVPKAGIHLTYAGSRADVDYKLLHHGESGQILAMKATAKGQRLNFCKVDQKTVLDMEQLLRDNPVSVARAWESKSSILHKETQSPSELAKCQVPWALLTHPERYPDFWGRAS